jgi:hypothetical protein
VVNTVPNSDCCISWLKEAAAQPACSISFTCDKYSGNAPLVVHCTAGPNDCTSWIWELPDGGEPDRYNDETPPAFNFDTPGTFRIQLSALNSRNQDTYEKTITVTGSTQGAIKVYPSPPGVDTYVDDSFTGTAPATAGSAYIISGLKPGTHKLVLKLDGYEDYSDYVTVVAGQATEVSATLTKSSSSLGSLEIKSVPSGASATLDGGSQGTTPVIVKDLSPGKYTVGLAKSGYDDYSGPVTVVANKRTTVTITLDEKSGGSTDDDESVTTTKEDSASTTGSIHVESVPSGAGVNIDGWDKGKTPVTVSQVKPGSHTITVKLAGYSDYTNSIEVKAGYRTSVTVPLKQESQTGSGTLTVRSNPTGATVYLDGDKKGTAPLELQNVPAGSHKVLLTMQGYGDSSQTVEMTDGSNKEVSVSLAKATPGFATVLSVAALALIVLALGWKRRGR